MSSLLAADAELLEAALEIVESWDVGYLPRQAPSSSASSASSSDDTLDSPTPSLSSSPSLPETVLAPIPTQVETARSSRRLQPSTLSSTHHRRRQEISHLTRKVAELERQLEALERTRPTARGPSGRPPRSARASMWRDIATHQLQLRIASETDQAKLRERVDALAGLARGMVKLLKKARQMENDDIVQSLKRQSTMARGFFPVQPADQLQHIKDLYGKMDHFHSHPKFTDGSMKFIDTNIHETRPHHYIIEVSEAWTVPFHEDDVMEALWKFSIRRQTESLCAPEYVLDSDVQINGTELVSNFSVLTSIGPAQGYFDGRAIIKRFPKTRKTPHAIITSLCFTPNEASAGDFTGVGNQAISCFRVLPTTDGETSQPACRVTFTERFAVTFDENFEGRRCATNYTAMTLEKLKHNLEVMHETVETLLLTRAQ